MIRWEYNTIVMDASIPEAVPALDEAGQDGWEVISFYAGAYGVVYLMKRPLPVMETAKPGDPIIKHNHSTERPCRNGCEWFGTVHQINW